MLKDEPLREGDRRTAVKTIESAQCRHADRKGFVRFSLEAPKEEWFFYAHFNGITAEMLIVMMEDEDITEEELDEIADLFNFPYRQFLRESYDASNHQTYREHKRWTKEFMLAIGALTVTGS